VTQKSDTRKVQHIVAVMFVCLLGIIQIDPASAAELQRKTAEAFEHYMKVAESQPDLIPGPGDPFLWIDRLPASRQARVERQLRHGDVVIEKLESLDNGKRIECPGGMIHHWIGTVFIPGVTLAQTLALVEDYDHHQDYYAPDVMRSKILRREENDYLVNLRFYKHKVIASVVDTDHQVHYTIIDAAHALSRSRTTRVQQVENAGKSNEHLLPEGHDDGFLWRMNTYWRFEEKDNGTYVECQTISLTRDIPTGLGWLIGGYVNSVPRESLTFTLATTRSAVLQRARK
jgi:hypothetical protein